MRKVICLFLTLITLLSFVACSPVTEDEVPTASISADPTASAPTDQATTAPTAAPTATPEAKDMWIVSDDGWTFIESQSTEVQNGMVLETVTVSMSSSGTFIQLDHLLTKLIGKNGQDGEGYVQIVAGNGTAAELADSYMLVQLVGSSYTGYHIPGTPSFDALTWYTRGNGTSIGYCSVFLNQGGSNSVPNIKYGTHDAVCREGYKFAFTRLDDGRVCLRSLNANANAAIKNYDTSITLTSEYTLGDLVGDNGQTGEDGVYFRLSSYSSKEQLFTITVAYPA